MRPRPKMPRNRRAERAALEAQAADLKARAERILALIDARHYRQADPSEPPPLKRC